MDLIPRPSLELALLGNVQSTAKELGVNRNRRVRCQMSVGAARRPISSIFGVRVDAPPALPRKAAAVTGTAYQPITSYYITPEPLCNPLHGVSEEIDRKPSGYKYSECREPALVCGSVAGRRRMS